MHFHRGLLLLLVGRLIAHHLVLSMFFAILNFPWSRLPVLIFPWPGHLHWSSLRRPCCNVQCCLGGGGPFRTSPSGKKEVLSLMGIKYSKNTIVGEILVFLHPSDTQEGFFHFDSSHIPERNENMSFLHLIDTHKGFST